VLNVFSQGVPSAALREICLLKELKHKNIVRYTHFCMCEMFLPGSVSSTSASTTYRLMDVLHRNLKLTMVFEFCDQVGRLCCVLV